MSTTSKSPRKVALVALDVGTEALPAYCHRFNPKVFTQPQLFACLVLKEFFKADYRGIMGILADTPGLRDAISQELLDSRVDERFGRTARAWARIDHAWNVRQHPVVARSLSSPRRQSSNRSSSASRTGSSPVIATSPDHRRDGFAPKAAHGSYSISGPPATARGPAGAMRASA